MALLATMILLLQVVKAQAQPLSGTRDPRTPGTVALPRALTEDEIETLRERIAAAIVPLRATTDLGAGFRPRLQQGDGVALWLQLPDDPNNAESARSAQLVTSWSWLATATQIEVWTGEAWVAASVEFGGPTFDLARITTAHTPTATPLELAPEMPLDALLFGYQPPADSAAAPRTQGPRIRGGQQGTIVPAAMGPRPQGDLAYYVRSMLSQRNGLPVLDRDGRVIALASLFSPEGTGSLAIATPQVLEWWGMRDRLDATAPGGFRPRIERETFDLQTGEEALRSGGRNTSPRPTSRFNREPRR